MAEQPKSLEQRYHQTLRDHAAEEVPITVNGEQRMVCRYVAVQMRMFQDAAGDNNHTTAARRYLAERLDPVKADGPSTIVLNVLPAAADFTRRVIAASGAAPPTPDGIVGVLAGMRAPALLPAPDEATPSINANNRRTPGEDITNTNVGDSYKANTYGNVEADHTPHTPPDVMLEGDKPQYGALTDALAPIPDEESDTDG